MTEHVLGDGFRRQAVGDDPLHCVDYFGTPTVIESYVEGDGVVVARQFQRFGDLPFERVGDADQTATMANSNPVLVQFLQLITDGAAEKLHQGAHFSRRPVPVFSREGVDRKNLDAGVDRRFEHATYVVRAGAVAEHSRLAALLRPASIAIHDDADMIWNPQAAVVRLYAVGVVDRHGCLTRTAYTLTLRVSARPPSIRLLCRDRSCRCAQRLCSASPGRRPAPYASRLRRSTCPFRAS